MTEYFALLPILGIAGLAVAFIIYHIKTRHNHGDGAVKDIADQIHQGTARRWRCLSLFKAAL